MDKLEDAQKDFILALNTGGKRQLMPKTDLNISCREVVQTPAHREQGRTALVQPCLG